MSENITTPAPVVDGAAVVAIATKAAAELDDRKSKLAFAKQVIRASATGVSNDDFATALTTARVLRVYPEVTNEAEIERLAKSDSLNMSSSKVSNYGTTLNQLNAAKAPVTEVTFGDWFKLVTKPGSAKLRNSIISEMAESDADAETKAAVIKQAAKDFVRTPVQREVKMTLERVAKFLAEVAEADFGSDAQAVSDLLFEVGALVADGVDAVESETVDA